MERVPLSAQALSIAAILSAALAGTSSPAQAAEAQAASAALTGFASHGKKGKQTYTLLAHVAHEPDPGTAGGIAAFGVGDEGPVMLLAHARYVPSLMPAGARRELATPTPPLDAKQLPRFVMVCAWPLHDDKPGKPVAGYAERDDATLTVKPNKYSTGLTVQWVTIPSRRAPAAFAARDYCGEIARSGKSSAPLWLLDRSS